MQLNVKTILFQTIQFSINTPCKHRKVVFEPIIGPYQVLPLRVRVDLGAMAIDGYFSITGAPPSYCLVSYLGHSLGKSYSSAKL